VIFLPSRKRGSWVIDRCRTYAGLSGRPRTSEAVGVEYDYRHADSGEMGVTASPYVCQERLQILVRVPDVEGERLEVVDRLDPLQALPTGDLLEYGTGRRPLLIDSLPFGHVTPLRSDSGLRVCQAPTTEAPTCQLESGAP
jgi:hypothetical protein